MGEHAIRDLNDKINKLFREKYHWNRRIIELGGPNYNAIERKRIREEEESQIGLKGSGGYRYFGAAKDLPGVKELFTKQAGQAVSTKRKRAEIIKNITADYYGIRDEDDDDGIHLVSIEHEQSKKNKRLLEQELDEHINKCKEDGIECCFSKDAGDEDFVSDEDIDFVFTAQMAIPSQELMSQIVLEQRKSELLSKLAF